MTSLQNKAGNWIFITPIDGLELTKEVNEEFLVNRVIFVSKEKLPRIRKRLQIPVPISEFYKANPNMDSGVDSTMKDFFSSSKAYAVLPYKGKPKEKVEDCIRIIKDELNILSLSQLGWSTRRFNRRIGIKTSDGRSYYRRININKKYKEYNLGFQTTYSPVPFKTEKNWVNFHKRFFFFELIEIIRCKTKVSKKWRTILHRAAIMAGQSQNSNDLPSCFLWNVIVLEMLLTEADEKILDNLVRRSNYFLGWNEEWNNENYETRIREIYKKRCDFVHKGDLKYIKIEDLLFTDDLIFNILNNIVKYKDKILDRSDIVTFCEKYEAAKLLGQESEYQFGKFEIVRKHYTPDDYNKI